MKDIGQQQITEALSMVSLERTEDKSLNSIRKIGITYNLKEEVLFQGEIESEQVEELDQFDTIQALSDVFKKNGYETANLGGGLDIVEKIKQERPDFVFNIAEGFYGRNREGHIPSILEMIGIPYSGSDPLTLALTLDKSIAKQLFIHLNISTPKYFLVKTIDDILGMKKKLKYPLITKPAWEGSSKGIYNVSKADNIDILERNIKYLSGKFPDQPVLVEEYIKGREITVGIVGNNPKSVLGIMEIASKSKQKNDFIYSLEVKRDWKNQVEYIIPPKLDDVIKEKIKNYAILAFNEFGCRDFARMDFRISEENEAYLLEINPLAGLSPSCSDLVIMSGKLGINYESLILSILESALLRYNIDYMVQDSVEINSLS